jgi:hypothetical protein
LTGQQPKSARNEFYYFDDDGLLVAMRFDDWKVVFCEQRAIGGFSVWQDPFTCLRVPKIFNLRMDPFERADLVSDQYNDWLVKNVYLAAIATMKGTEFLNTFVAYPPSQKPASFTVDQARKSVDEQIERLEKQRAAATAAKASRKEVPRH